MESQDIEEKETINYVNFNYDGTCFMIGTTKGFRIYNADPLQLIYQRQFKNTSIKLVEMVDRCNILALVGQGENYQLNKVIFWNDINQSPFGDLNFKSNVLNIKLSKKAIVVVLEKKLYKYNFNDLGKEHVIDNLNNPEGICAAMTSDEITQLAIPGEEPGEVIL